MPVVMAKSVSGPAPSPLPHVSAPSFSFAAVMLPAVVSVPSIIASSVNGYKLAPPAPAGPAGPGGPCGPTITGWLRSSRAIYSKHVPRLLSKLFTVI